MRAAWPSGFPAARHRCLPAPPLRMASGAGVPSARTHASGGLRLPGGPTVRAGARQGNREKRLSSTGSHGGRLAAGAGRRRLCAVSPAGMLQPPALKGQNALRSDSWPFFMRRRPAHLFPAGSPTARSRNRPAPPAHGRTRRIQDRLPKTAAIYLRLPCGTRVRRLTGRVFRVKCFHPCTAGAVSEDRDSRRPISRDGSRQCRSHFRHRRVRSETHAPRQ